MNVAARRWWREPVAWLLVALPLASVVATIVLVRVGGGGATFDAAPEPVQRSAQVQQRDLAADERALALGLAGGLRVVAGGVQVRVDRGAPGRDDAGGPVRVDGLVLTFVHPADAARDRVATLDADGRATIDVDPSIRWRLRLAPADGAWRLVGTWTPEAAGREQSLLPAFAPAPPEPAR